MIVQLATSKKEGSSLSGGWAANLHFHASVQVGLRPTQHHNMNSSSISKWLLLVLQLA
jgi:hypothetical protein